VIILIIKKIDAIPALFIGTLLGAAAAVIFQPDLMTQISGESGNYLYVAYKGTMDAMFGGISILSDDFGQFEPLLNQFGQAKDIPTAQITALEMESKEYQQLIIKDAETYKAIHKLFATGGMFGMMNTVWLIICAMAFGGIMEACGLLQRITSAVVSLAKTTGSLISTTVGTCVFFNATASDQYLSIVVPGRMFAKTYKDRGLAPQNLSRTLEDSGTVTSVLFPWNTCGAAQSTVLGVATGEYWMYCFFNLISPVMTMIYGYFGIKIAKLSADGKK
jgi:NhaC family Na+:H+ antiporter